MEKYINYFESLNKLDQYNEIKKVSNSLFNRRKKIEKILLKNSISFSSNSHSNARRNMSMRSKNANDDFEFRMMHEEKDLLIEYLKRI